ncbi:MULTISPECIES: hypothetical protein [Aeromonas]|uniref:hypothetical protein n=1 Tax=Aeromonas TaxID=642 RepID=UPI0022EA18BA|nr:MULTISPECIES: hypothetical protein [Aeromonas]MDA3318481.1 hypothetical protein [Aeromonas sp. PI_26]
MRLILLLCSLICYGMAYPVLAGPLADRLAGELARQAPEQALPIDEVRALARLEGNRLILTLSSASAGELVWPRVPAGGLGAGAAPSGSATGRFRCPARTGGQTTGRCAQRARELGRWQLGQDDRRAQAGWTNKTLAGSAPVDGGLCRAAGD